MRQIADVDGIEQPDGSSMHRRTHTPDPLWPFTFVDRVTELQRKRSAASQLTALYGQLEDKARFRRKAVPFLMEVSLSVAQSQALTNIALARP
jgi:hypothetical protein